ncbi:MAG: GNAT family N-acetyltransferase [Alphaproteobacteria bacterium]|nr:GNAT family N-acetyltransferase [Alphaproteobacteria bacterium]MBU1278749.1 GNAT family N-acetyltransferase [Alphaproteobacteria bacterium]MBU1575449.1 GNAT family N-acetyltransferase [Alphaproteobacteria bacterium]MBU1827539.1 GNAT family N-acetyltransferase [Alphaproteobacteria bacterium]MBU2077779.1 GNAT family N-acetyltransferase [Alphaproteobacteria bacterium]
MIPERILAHDPRLPQVLRLIQTEFADMDGRIDPPSSMHRLTLDAIATEAATDEIWAMGTPPGACVILTPKSGRLYIGKLAVAKSLRGTGLARHLMHHAEVRALDLGLAVLELQTRVELIENHATFRALGFEERERTAHVGYDRPTSITFQKRLSATAKV